MTPSRPRTVRVHDEQYPPTRSWASTTSTFSPRLASKAAADRPPIPDPTTTTWCLSPTVGQEPGSGTLLAAQLDNGPFQGDAAHQGAVGAHVLSIAHGFLVLP